MIEGRKIATEVDLDTRELADEAIHLVEHWLAASRLEPVDLAAKRLAGVLSDPNGLAFTVGFVDGVMRPEDTRVAARALRDLAPLIPRFLPIPMRWLIRIGSHLAPILPWIVIPVSRFVLRRMVRHLVVDARPRALGRTIQYLRRGASHTVRLNVNLLGEAILGKGEAARRIEGTERVLARDDVDYVSIKVSSTVAPHSVWSFDEAVADAVEALAPLFRLAAAAPGGAKFINLDMEEYKDLELTLAVFTALLDRPEFTDLTAGIVLQAYLPDALGVMIRLQDWSAARVAAGGAPIKVRVVKGANLPMERVDADLHGWPLATWSSKLESDASYKAVLDYALRPEHIGSLRIGIAGHNLFDIAFAWLLANRRGVTAGIDIEMLLGMASAQAAVIAREVGSVLLYTPIVHPREFDVAIAYLIRRLEEGASSENFMSALFDLDRDRTLFERERDRFLASVEAIPVKAPRPRRVQDRRAVPNPAPADRFENTPDSDPSTVANRAWATSIRDRMRTSRLGSDLVHDSRITDVVALDDVIARAVAAGVSWRALGADGRATYLHRAGDELQARRAELLEVMGSECGKVIEQGDPEVSEAIDFAHWYAEQGRMLEAVNGASFRPVPLTVVTPPWNFPVAIPAGGVLAALATGSPVVIKPATQARRSAAVMVEALWAAGIPRDVLQFVSLEDRSLGRELIADERVGRVILTGGYETAELFRGFRTDLPLLAETSGKNAIIVTPSADLDMAARDVVHSAFGHAGQKCSAASLVVLVGTVADSSRFRRQIIDATRALRVGYPWEESSQVGPLIGPAEGKLARALTELDPGESWVVAPERLDADGTLWRPGIREGVRPSSEFHLTEYFGPVLGVMTARSLDEAIGYVNAIDYGLTSGLHSLDGDEIDHWLNTVEAGNLYVNRGTTGAIVQRQPFGGWKRSAVGTGAKAGGPNYLLGLGDWDDASPRPTVATPDALTELAAASVDQSERVWLLAALATDVDAWHDEFGTARDATGLNSEQNVLRYQALPVTVRFEHGSASELVRVVAAGVRLGAPVTVSSHDTLEVSIGALFVRLGVDYQVENAAEWALHADRLADLGGRVRLIGGSAAAVATAVNGAPSLAIYGGPVLSASRIESLVFVREQAVSITAHRYGTPQRHEVAASIFTPSTTPIERYLP